MQRIIVKTEDGSSSVFVPELNESYHSKFGSVQESRHVFIQAGLEAAAANQDSLRVLEIGFGTGLNAYLSYVWSQEHGAHVEYHAVEPYPLPREIYGSLNYAQVLNVPGLQDVFLRMHESDWNTMVLISPGFTLQKYQKTLDDVELSQSFGLIYFDAFAPRVQPELWTESVFAKMYALLKPGGILVTYCAKGDVKRNMKAAGFIVEALPGPKGKREMTRARKV